MRPLRFVVPMLVAACSAKPPPAAPSHAAAQDVIFTGMCDASGAVALTDTLFAVADDEDNLLRIYDAGRGGAAVATSDALADMARDLAGPGKHKHGKKPARELDIEGATRLGDVALWITSHGRSSSGKERPERLVLFGTTAPASAARIERVGAPYVRLMEELAADPRFSTFGLAEAAERAPKDPGGLNIEGLTERPDGTVFIGFRNPVPGGKALLVPLLNPLPVLNGARASFGDPVLLDLGGLSIRSLSRWRGRYLIAAGHFADGAASRLVVWDGSGAPQPVAGVDLQRFNPEAFFTPESAHRILLLSDDGSDVIDGVTCKRLPEAGHKRFRGRWITLPAP